MSKRFLQLIPSEETMYLVIHKPNAFRLLTIIATRARRENGHPDGLTAGQCHLGDWKACGFTEQEYRTAKDILIMRQHLKIVETCRTRKKSTNGTTTRGTLVELISSTVYDINSDSINDRINDRATTEQRPSNDEQERIRKNKKEEKEKIKKEKIEKIAFRPNVLMEQAQYDKLVAEHGKAKTEDFIERLSLYQYSRAEDYASAYHTILSWMRNEKNKSTEKIKSISDGPEFHVEIPMELKQMLAQR